MTNPTPSATPTTTRKHRYTVARLDLNALNSVLTQIGLRLDQVEAIGQNPDFKGRRGVNLGLADRNSDAARKDQISLSIFSTDDLAEGTTNLYFTDERVDDRINTLFIAGTGIEFTYDDIANTFTVAVLMKADSGIVSDAGGIYVEIKAASGLAVDADGLATKLKPSYGIDVDADGLKLKQQAHEANAVTAHAITDPADTPATADALRDDLVVNTIPAIESALNALGTKINNILSKLETAEVLASA